MDGGNTPFGGETVYNNMNSPGAGTSYHGGMTSQW